ncbi:MAG: hypothetical protein Fur0041_00550 [Bacteroidia bacterium]
MLLIIGMGTNLYWYGSYDSSMPHIYLFAIDCAILLLTISWHEKPSVVKAVGLGLLLGWGVITRPSEVVWVFIPLLWGVYNLKTLQQKIRLLLQFKHHVFFLAMAACLPGIMQMSYWYYTTGHLLSYNHGEAFDFLHPFTIKALFSYKKGWLLYTPVMIFAIAGFVFLYKKKKELFWPLFVFFISNLYIITSWECWWYAGTFGQRPFVQSYGLMAIPLGFLLDAFRQRRTLYLSLLSVLSVLTLFNQFQAWQMKNGIIHSELMTKEYYWAVFGKTTYDRSLTRYLEVDRNNLPPLHSSENDYIKTVVYNAGYESPGETGPFQLLCDTFGYNSQHSTLLNQEKQFVKNWESPFDALTQKNYLRFRISADFYFTEDVTDKPVYFTFGMIGIRDQSYGYQAVPVQPDSMHKWVHHEMEFVTPPVLHRSDKIIMNIWNQGGTPVYIDNVRIEMFNPKEAYGY